MKQRICAQEESISQAVRTGVWAGSLSRHVAECEPCGEIVRASRWMQTLISIEESGAAALPNASVLWWRAQLAQGDRKLITRRRAVEWLQITPVLLVCVALPIVGIVEWDVVESALAWLASDVWSRIVFVGYLLAVWEPNLLWAALILASLLIVLLAYPLVERA